MTKTIVVAAFFASLFSILTGCTEEAQTVATDNVKSVDWYKAHKTERLAQIEVCRNDPGELKHTADCVNANSAAAALTWSSKNGVTVPAPLTFSAPKPKTQDQAELN